MNAIPVERHPLQPFLPEGARLLMLGSFPPPRMRWSMDFFYPNNYNQYVQYYMNTFQHGGISMEEILIPFITLRSK